MIKDFAVDYQIAFNLAVGTTAFFGGWILNKIGTAIEKLDADVRDMPKVYVTKVDYKDDLNKIDVMLNKIYDKLDHKVDK